MALRALLVVLALVGCSKAPAAICSSSDASSSRDAPEAGPPFAWCPTGATALCHCDLDGGLRLGFTRCEEVELEEGAWGPCDCRRPDGGSR